MALGVVDVGADDDESDDVGGGAPNSTGPARHCRPSRTATRKRRLWSCGTKNRSHLASASASTAAPVHRTGRRATSGGGGATRRDIERRDACAVSSPPPPSLPATCRPKKKRQKKRRNAERKKLPDRPSCTQATPRKTNRSAPCRSIRSISITPEVRWTCNSSTVRIVGDSRANDEYRAQNSSGEGGVRVEYVSLIGHQKERQKAFGRRLAVPRSKFFFARAHTHTHKLMERGQISLSRRATVSSFWPFVCPKDSKRKRSAAGAAPIRFHFVDAPEIQRNRARWRLRQKKQIRGVGGGGGKKGRNRSAPEPTVGWYCQSARLIN